MSTSSDVNIFRTVDLENWEPTIKERLKKIGSVGKLKRAYQGAKPTDAYEQVNFAEKLRRVTLNKKGKKLTKYYNNFLETATVIHILISTQKGHFHLLKEIKVDPSLSVSAKTKRNPLHYIHRYRNSEIAEYLCEKGCRINKQSEPDGRTPLHLAALSGNTPVVKVLIAHGAKTDIQDSEGATPLMIALSKRHFRVALTLKKHSTKNSATCTKGRNTRDILSLVAKNDLKAQNNPFLLPKDIWFLIFNHLDEDSLSNILLTCKSLNSYVIRHLV